MSDDATGGRPSQVTVAGWTAVVASFLLVFSIFDQMGALHSVAMREEVQRMLSTGSGGGFGLSVAEALTAIRWALFVAGAAAAAAAILGFFVLRRDRPARIGLTVVTVPLVICAPFAGGFLAAVVAASTAMLWTGPARDWFAGRKVRQSAAFLSASRGAREAQDREEHRRAEPPAFVAPPPGQVSGGSATDPGDDTGDDTGGDPGDDTGDDTAVGTADGTAGGDRGDRAGPGASTGHDPDGGPAAGGTADGPAPTYGYGAAPGQHAGAPWSGPAQPGPAQPGPAQPGPAQPGPAQPWGAAWPPPHGPATPLGGPHAGRPRSVQTACIIATVFTGISLLGALVLVVVLLVSPSTLQEQATSMPEWKDSGLDADLLLPALWTWAVVLVLWCVAALVLVWFTWRRSNGARIALIVSAVLAGVVGVLGFPVTFAHLIGCAAVVGLLASAPAREWFARSGNRSGPW
ncbi:MAG TPA: hypothetical protein VFO98_06530 [Marmoricola sp.]|nr:hypothetical protein [Marmoricola sp.]